MTKFDRYIKVYRKCRQCHGEKECIKRECMGQSNVEYRDSCNDCDEHGMEFIGYEKYDYPQ